MKINVFKKWWFWVVVVIVAGVVGNVIELMENNNYTFITEDNRIEGERDIGVDYITQYRAKLNNTVWEPDFVVYPNNYHENNPILTLTNVSEDGTVLKFIDEKGRTYETVICDGWDNPGKYDPNVFEEGVGGIQYLFENSKPFYGLTVYGCAPKSTSKSRFEEPTLFVEVERGGWYKVVYKIKN